jgi:membrane protein implicated in regulation of membrane protease activity
MKKIISRRNLLVGIATLLIGLGTSAAIWGVPKFLKRSTSIKGQVNAYLLDDQGAVNGLLLSTGAQLHFKKETGSVVTSQIKVGDEVRVVGHAGTQLVVGTSTA